MSTDKKNGCGAFKKSEARLRMNRDSARIITRETNCMQMVWQIVGGGGRH